MTLADDVNNSIATVDVNRAIIGNVAMQVAKLVANASSTSL